MRHKMHAVDPGIDISHYGAPYQGMLGVGSLGSYTEQPGFDYDYATAGVGMLYRYGAGLGVEPWTGAPSEDPRIVKKYTTIRSTYRVRNLGGDRTAARAADAILAKARSLFSGNTVRKIGTTGWTSEGKVGYEVILANPTRAGEIKQKNYRAGQQAASQMGGDVSFYDAQTSIPANAFTDAPPTAPAIPETTPSATADDAGGGNFLTQKVAGLPVWAVGLIGIGVVGGAALLLTRGGKKSAPAPTPNRRRRRRSSRRRRRLR